MEKPQRKKDQEKDFFGLMSSGEGRAFFGKGCCENVRMPSGKEKEDWRDFFKVECRVFLSKEIVLGHPCIPRVRVDTGSDKRPGMRKKGRSWRRGGGGEGAGQIRGTKG